jgi:hypothetical protein
MISKKNEENLESATKVSIGVAIPMSATSDCTKEHWSEVFSIIESAFSDDDKYKVKIVSKSNEMAIIQDAIVNNLYHNDVVICDVSCGNPNVMFELGMRLAFDKPTIVIKDLETPYTFDTAPIRHIEYPRSLRYQSILDFKEKLRLAVDEILHPDIKKTGKRTFLSNFGNLTAAKVQDKEMPEGQYIINRLESLMNKVDNLERSSVPRIPTNNIHISEGDFDDIALTIDRAITEIANQNDFELPNSIKNVPENILLSMRNHARNAIRRKHNIEPSEALFKRMFEKGYDFATIPF